MGSFRRVRRRPHYSALALVRCVGGVPYRFDVWACNGQIQFRKSYFIFWNQIRCLLTLTLHPEYTGNINVLCVVRKWLAGTATFASPRDRIMMNIALNDRNYTYSFRIRNLPTTSECKYAGNWFQQIMHNIRNSLEALQRYYPTRSFSTTNICSVYSRSQSRMFECGLGLASASVCVRWFRRKTIESNLDVYHEYNQAHYSGPLSAFLRHGWFETDT